MRLFAQFLFLLREFFRVDWLRFQFLLAIFDFLLRLRSAGSHVSFTYILPVAVPPAEVVNGLPRIPTRFAPAAGITHVSDDQNAWPALWAAERAVAEAFGLTPDDFAHIFETFPVWLRKRHEIAGYYRARLEEWRRGAR